MAFSEIFEQNCIDGHFFLFPPNSKFKTITTPKFKSQNKNKSCQNEILKSFHDLEIEKLNFESLKMNENDFAWHIFCHHIWSIWSWFQASNSPFNLQKFQMKFLQLWHHQGCVIIFSPFIVETSQSDRWNFLLRTLEKK